MVTVSDAIFILGTCPNRIHFSNVARAMILGKFVHPYYTKYTTALSDSGVTNSPHPNITNSFECGYCPGTQLVITLHIAGSIMPNRRLAQRLMDQQMEWHFGPHE